MLSESALSCLSWVYHLMDVIGEGPRQAQSLVVFLMGRPDKGRRPIGHYRAFERLHGKTHRDPCRSGEARVGLGPEFSMGQGKSSLDMVWRQSVASERASGEKIHLGQHFIGPNAVL